MDDKPIYVTLDAMVPIKDNDEGVLLVKKVEQTYLEGTVEDLIRKLIDPEADALNEAYNAEERDVANTVSKWFRDMNADPDNYKVSIKAIVDNGEPIPLDLDGRVAEYDSIIRTKEEIDSETNAKEKYKLIDFIARRSVPGGTSAYVNLEDKLCD